MTLTITATVGRNVAGVSRIDGQSVRGVPLTVGDWEALQRRVRNTLTYATTGKGRTETHYGVGTWDGVTEESAAITRYGTAWRAETAAEIAPAESLRAELGEIARVYRQEAIALVVGEGELIAPLSLPPVRRAESEGRLIGLPPIPVRQDTGDPHADFHHNSALPWPSSLCQRCREILGDVRRCSCTRADYGDPGHDGNRHAHALGDRGVTRQDSALADRVALDFV